MEWLAFAFVIAVGQLTPGPDMLLILKNTLNHGLRAGLITIGGIVTGLFVHTVAAFSGLALMLNGSPRVFRTLQILGGAYLIWISWKILRSLVRDRTQPVLPKERQVVPLSVGEAYREGLFTNLLNVKVVIFFSSVMASFAARDNFSAAVYGTIIMAEAMILWPGFAWVMQKRAVQQLFFRYQSGINGVFAIILFGLALHLWWPQALESRADADSTHQRQESERH